MKNLSLENKFELMKKQNRLLKEQLKEQKKIIKLIETQKLDESMQVDNFTKLLKNSVLAGIKSCLFDHGPINSSNIPSVTKRIVGNIEGNIKGTITGKIKCY